MLCQKNWHLTLNKSGKNAPMRFQSDFPAVTLTVSNLFSTVPKVAPVFFLPVLHGGIGTKTGGAHVCFKFIVARSYTADGNLLQPTGGCKQYISHVMFFSCLCAFVMLCYTTLAPMFVGVISSVCHALECLISLRPSLRTLHLFSHLPLHPPEF